MFVEDSIEILDRARALEEAWVAIQHEFNTVDVCHLFRYQNYYSIANEMDISEELFRLIYNSLVLNHYRLITTVEPNKITYAFRKPVDR